MKPKNPSSHKSLPMILTRMVVVLCCLNVMFTVDAILAQKEAATHADKIVVLVSFPDISHIVDLKEIAKSLTLLNITTVEHTLIVNTRDVYENTTQFSSFFTMVNIKDYSPRHSAFRADIEGKLMILKSDTPMEAKYQTAFQFMSDLYEPTVKALDELFENHPLLKKAQPSQLMLLIDGIFTSAVEWAQ